MVTESGVPLYLSFGSVYAEANTVPAHNTERATTDDKNDLTAFSTTFILNLLYRKITCKSLRTNQFTIS